MARKQLSGAQKRKLKREREEAEASQAPTQSAPAAPGTTPAPIAPLVGEVGPPPLGDPLQLVVWGQKLAAVVAWDLATGKPYDARRRGILDAVRSIGMVSVKANERKKLGEVSKKLGLGEKDGEDGVEPYSGRRGPPVGG